VAGRVNAGEDRRRKERERKRRKIWLRRNYLNPSRHTLAPEKALATRVQV